MLISLSELFRNLITKKNMFVLSRDVSAAKRVIATLLAIAVTMWALGFSSFAEAANLTDVKDTLTDSAPSAASNHSIQFISPSGVATSSTIVITFDAATFSLANIGEEDIDVLVNGTNRSNALWSTATSATSITLTFGGTSIAAGATTTILIGLHAINEGSPNTQIVNPNPVDGNESYEIDISAGASDTGHTRVVILDTVLVTAQVNTTFNFTVYGLASSTNINGALATGASSSTTIPFGVLVANAPKVLGHDLTVGTNAANGFVVTVESDGYFDSSTGAIIDNYQDGTVVTDPETWAAPANNISLANTWGHWGVTSEDTNTNGNRAFEFGANEWAGVTTSPTVIFAHNGPADASTFGIGSTTVGYKVEITPLQEAGDDYSTILTYIATPTF